MWLKWLPWRYLVGRIAKRHGFMDPVDIMARLERFSQPSEVAAPIELLRAGMIFHARGLMNTKAIQHNLDWVWPYWVERQFDPRDESFVPRAFSVTHINLTHRNWTAVGLPDCNAFPLVDPRGLVTPFFDGWSIDAWIVNADAERWLLPSKCSEAQQQFVMSETNVAVRTRVADNGLAIASDVRVEKDQDGHPVCLIDYTACCPGDGWLVISLRPANPEGVSFVHSVQLSEGRDRWTINDQSCVSFDTPVDYHATSTYHGGDVRLDFPPVEETLSRRDEVGMVTAAGAVKLHDGQQRTLRITVDLNQDKDSRPVVRKGHPLGDWSSALENTCTIDIPDEGLQELYRTHLRTLILHSPYEVYAGPFTYKRFWFRDAAFILNAMICAGLTARAKRVLDTFPGLQTATGFFRSQEGEWDANGEVLWIMERYAAFTDSAPDKAWKQAIIKGAKWINRKRLDDDGQHPHSGLLPAGFSAEHLGTNDYYYWDDFWGVAGLRAAAAMAERWGDQDRARQFSADADDFLAAVNKSLDRSAARRDRPGMPASPYRRMDAGAIGSIVAGYPLQLFEPDDPKLLDTAEFLMQNCFCNGGFFQDMIHSGINAYLTMHIAQILLRAGNPKFIDITRTVADLASPTGQWPEAIHPSTKGGCMGDGQHAWAAAEWLMLIRAMFVREEGDRLVLLAGIPRAWLDAGEPIRFGPTWTRHGVLTLEIKPAQGHIAVSWEAHWHSTQPPVDLRLAACEAQSVEDASVTSVRLALR